MAGTGFKGRTMLVAAMAATMLAACSDNDTAADAAPLAAPTVAFTALVKNATNWQVNDAAAYPLTGGSFFL